MAKLKEQENVALTNLNLAKNELLALSNFLDKAALEQKKAIAEYGNAQYKVINIQMKIDENKKQLVIVEKEIASTEKLYKELQSKYEALNKSVQAAVSKAAASKKNAEAAYQALMAATNTNSLVAKDLQLYLETTSDTSMPTANATSALTKLKEQYQNAQSQANRDKALADKAVIELQTVREASLKAKKSLDEKIAQRSKLKSELAALEPSLKVAKSELEAADSKKVKAVSAYTTAANNFAQKTNKFRENEINYQNAKSETKYEFENANSKNNQVLALKKLSEWSKNSITTAKEIIDGIDNEVRNLESNQALDLLNSEVKVGFISTSIPIIIFTSVAIFALYAYLQRRRRRSKMVEIDPNLLEVIKSRRENQISNVKNKSPKRAKRVSKSR